MGKEIKLGSIEYFRLRDLSQKLNSVGYNKFNLSYLDKLRTEISLKIETIEGKCKHIITKGRNGESGSWCTDCGEKILDVEKNKCGDCKFYSKHLSGDFCSKRLMGVTPNMNVTFKVSEGTCFIDSITPTQP